jgi:hypothetical protein
LKTLKANGENFQVSWSSDATCWVIASKNVSLLAENEKQVDSIEYQKKRYDYAVLLAKEWFSIIKKMTLKKLEELK